MASSVNPMPYFRIYTGLKTNHRICVLTSRSVIITTTSWEGGGVLVIGRCRTWVGVRGCIGGAGMNGGAKGRS